MRALQITEHHDIDRLEVREVDAGPLRAGEVRVKVEAAGVNPSDVVSLRGRFQGAPLPRILGRDFAGVVVEGDAALIGKAVWGTGGDLGIARDGTHAELITLPRDAVAERPANLDAVTAASVGFPFLTALSALDLGALESGEVVLVAGAAGAVGHVATELALARGARVVALVRDQAEAERVSAIGRPKGILAVLPSDRPDLEREIRRVTQGHGADVALNGVGAPVFRILFDALAVGGRLVAYAGVPGAEVAFDVLSFYRRRLTFRGLDTRLVDAVSGARLLERMKPLFEAGAIRAQPGIRSFPLSEARAAYALVAAGKGDKAALTFGRE